MTFFLNATAHIAMMFIVLGTGACSTERKSDLYGYESEYALPEPDMIPVMPDDNPGRTVDEMLGLKPGTVIVKKGEYALRNGDFGQYEHQGRFGSKEKISLRKGLNAPDAGIVYGKGKRRPVEEVRGLEIEKQLKSEEEALSEEEILARIIAPKKTEVQIIEVVPAKTANLPAPAVREELVPAGTADYIPFEKNGRQDKEIVLLQPAALSGPVKRDAPENTPVAYEDTTPLKPEENKKEALSGDVMYPLISKAAVRKEKQAEGQEEIVLLKPLSFARSEQAETEEVVLLRLPVAEGEEERIVLIPPSKDRIVLKRPEERKSLPSVEIFLDE